MDFAPFASFTFSPDPGTLLGAHAEGTATALLCAVATRDEQSQVLGNTSVLDVASLTADFSATHAADKRNTVTVLPARPYLTSGSADVLVLVSLGEDWWAAAEADAAARDDRQALGATRYGILQEAAGTALRAAVSAKASRVVSLLPADSLNELEAVCCGLAQANYSWTLDEAPVPECESIGVALSADVNADAAQLSTVGSYADALGRTTALTRFLVNQPPNLLTPESFAELAVAEVDKRALPELSVTVWDDERLEAEGFGGIVGVGQGSVHPPRLVRVEWAPAEASRSVALIGKGITFDSGGLSLKPSASMPEMKSDMAGAATVLSTVLAAADLSASTRITAWLALAENMPGGCAQRPSDIVTMYGGTTVEITNTDAEGRLVMADALARAAEEHPDEMIDVATLTGAQIVALGTDVTGIMGTPRVRDGLVATAQACGEAAWAMPLPESLTSALSSPYATLSNAATRSKAGGGMLSAGLFLRHFTDGLPWAHVDIAGPSFNDGAPRAATPTGGTGAMIHTLLNYVSA